MAHVSRDYCVVCKKETEHINRQCIHCVNEKAGEELKKEKEASDKWMEQPMEERIRDLDLRTRKLERAAKIMRRENVRY